jgi:hypothetical protein
MLRRRRSVSRKAELLGLSLMEVARPASAAARTSLCVENGVSSVAKGISTTSVAALRQWRQRMEFPPPKTGRTIATMAGRQFA